MNIVESWILIGMVFFIGIGIGIVVDRYLMLNNIKKQKNKKMIGYFLSHTRDMVQKAREQAFSEPNYEIIKKNLRMFAEKCLQIDSEIFNDFHGEKWCVVGKIGKVVACYEQEMYLLLPNNQTEGQLPAHPPQSSTRNFKQEIYLLFCEEFGLDP